MRRVLHSIAICGIPALLAACQSDPFEINNDWGQGFMPGGGGGQSSSGSMILDTSVFSVSLDSSTAEPSDSATEYFPEDEDNPDNNSFSRELKINFNGSSASWGNVPDGVSVSSQGAHVTVDNGETKLSIVLSGTTTEGSLTLTGDKKYRLVLDGVSITNPDSSAVNLLNKKRAYVELSSGTENFISDGTSSKSEDHKAAFYCKGKLLFNGSGSLEIDGRHKNGLQCADYIIFRKGNKVSVASASGHGIKANDGIFINGGIINVEVSAEAAKAINCESDIIVNGGRTTAIASGICKYDTDDQEYKGAAAVKADGNITVAGGELLAKSSGTGGKGVKADGSLTVTGGTLTGSATEANYGSSSGKQMMPGGWGGSSSNIKSAKGIKAEGDISIKGGRVNAWSTGHEGLESKSAIRISGGSVYVIASDDAVNSAGDMTISGGTVYTYSSTNDGLDSNGDMYIKGGLVAAFGAGGAETGIDIDEKHKLYISGGELFGIGGRIDSSFGSGGQAYGTASNVSGQGYFVLSDGSSQIFAVKIPTSAYSGAALVSSSSMKSGSKYTVGYASLSDGSALIVRSPSLSSVTSSSTFTATK